MRALLILICLILFIPHVSPAAVPVIRTDISKDAEIVSTRGDSNVKFVKQQAWIPAVPDQDLISGDSLKTGNYGKLDILFIDGTQIKVHNKTILTIKSVKKPPVENTVLNLESGEIWSRAKSVPEGLRIDTPSVTLSIRGTDWDIAVDEKGTSYLTVIRGVIEMHNDQGSISVEAGEQAIAEIGKPPVKMFLVKPGDRVQWIISYPFNITKIIPFNSHRRDRIMELLPSAEEKALKDHADMQSRIFYAGLLYDLGEHGKSLELFDEVLKTDPENSRALIFKGLILLGRGEAENASSIIESAFKNSQGKDKIAASIGMAGVHIHNNELTMAGKLLEGLEQSEQDPVIGVAIANFMAYTGRFREAVEMCSEYAGRYKDDERFSILAADFSLVLDESHKSKELLDNALGINPRSSGAYSILGKYHFLAGRGKEAEMSYRKAVELDPNNAAALSGLGKLLMEKGHFEESKKVLSKAIEKDPGRHSHWSEKGMLLDWIEDIRGARGDLNKALELNASDYQSMNGLGYIALKEGRTEEAIQYFLKVSVLEPEFAEPHIFLAIAYYQLQDFERSLEELSLAQSLDPKDPLPHMIAHIIYQDTYRPFESVTEATKALELLPNLKSVNPIEKTQKGISNLGSALLDLGMVEWATSYAEESFNPYDASGYFFLSDVYDQRTYYNPIQSISTALQGFLLSPVSMGYSNRYQDIVRHPQHNLTVGTTIGDEDGGFARKHRVRQSGYMRKPFEISYVAVFENIDNEGFRNNGFMEENSLTFSFGLKPNYKNGFIVLGALGEKKFGLPGPVTMPDPDDVQRNRNFLITAGYSHRFGHNNYLLFDVDFYTTDGEFNNPSPLGSTGLNNFDISLINEVGLDDALAFQRKGIYFLGSIGPNSFYATDSTGTLALMLFPLLPVTVPSSLDTNSDRYLNNKYEEIGYQLRHIFDIGENHEATYGVEYYPPAELRLDGKRSITPTGGMIGLDDESFLPGGLIGMLEYQYGDSYYFSKLETESKLAYIADRWKPTDDLLLDLGIFYEYCKSNIFISEQGFSVAEELAHDDEFHPRAGASLKFGENHILRAAFQKRLYAGKALSLSPPTTAGLFYKFIQLVPCSKFTDTQIKVESRWTEKFFTSVSAERRDFYSISVTNDKNWTYFLTGALNTILTDRIGFFSIYTYSLSENRNGPNIGKTLPLLPRHSATAGIVLVFPQHISSTLQTRYFVRQFGDPENTYRLSDYTVTDLSVSWEPFKKHFLFKLDVNNVFDENYELELFYPAAGRSFFLTAEYRF